HSGSPRGSSWCGVIRMRRRHDPAHLARRLRPLSPHAGLLDLWPRGCADALPRRRSSPARMAVAADAADPPTGVAARPRTYRAAVRVALREHLLRQCHSGVSVTEIQSCSDKAPEWQPASWAFTELAVV